MAITSIDKKMEVSHERNKKTIKREGTGIGKAVDAGLPKHGRHPSEIKNVICGNNRTNA
jgi:hypothetical protein